MDAETIKTNVTLKFGKRVYAKGKTYHAPFSHDLISEIRSGSPTITVLKRTESPSQQKIDKVSPEVIIIAETSELSETVDLIPVVEKKEFPKPIAKRRGRKPKR